VEQSFDFDCLSEFVKWSI